MAATNIKRMWVLLTLTIVIAAGVLGVEAFRDDDFCRFDSPMYTAIAQNINLTGDWVNLFSSIDRPFEGDHPPFTFWATALCLKLFGNTVFGAIAFSLFSAVAACVVVFFIGVLLKNDIAGFLGGMGLLLTRYVPRIARHNTIEIPLMLFVSLAVLFIILAHKKHRAFYLPFGVCTAFAILSKGVVGFFPLGICFFAIIAEKRFRDLWNPFFLGGIFFSIAGPAAWLFVKGGMTSAGAITVLQQYIGFVVSVSHRASDGSRMRLITKLLELCFIIVPGVVLGLYFVIRDSFFREKRKDLLVILIWAALFIAAFLISGKRRGFYLLPMYPAMAVLFGIGLEAVIPRNFRMYTVYLISAFFAGNIAAPFLFPHWEPESIPIVLQRNTYLPAARRAVEAVYAQSPEGMRFVSYMQRDENEFVFFFGEDHDLDICQSLGEFEELAVSASPVLFYIPKKQFSQMDKKWHKKLKIVYAFDDQLLVTNQLDMAPVFDVEQKREQ